MAARTKNNDYCNPPAPRRYRALSPPPHLKRRTSYPVSLELSGLIRGTSTFPAAEDTAVSNLHYVQPFPAITRHAHVWRLLLPGVGSAVAHANLFHTQTALLFYKYVTSQTMHRKLKALAHGSVPNFNTAFS
ncbi:unnamed protein product, partial [Ectocarpus sp. 8 AP-2014]